MARGKRFEVFWDLVAVIAMVVLGVGLMKTELGFQATHEGPVSTFRIGWLPVVILAGAGVLALLFGVRRARRRESGGYRACALSGLVLLLMVPGMFLDEVCVSEEGYSLSRFLFPSTDVRFERVKRIDVVDDDEVHVLPASGERFTFHLGDLGRRALETFEERARSAGVSFTRD